MTFCNTAINIANIKGGKLAYVHVLAIEHYSKCWIFKDPIKLLQCAKTVAIHLAKSGECDCRLMCQEKARIYVHAIITKQWNNT